MAAYAEGLNILRHANAGNEQRARRRRDGAARAIPSSTSTTSTSREIAEVWRRGSVVAVVAARPHGGGARAQARSSASFAGRVSDSGEGRWTLKAAIDEGVPAPILSTAIGERFASRGAEEFRRPRPVGHALRIRWSPREEVMSAPQRSDALVFRAAPRRSLARRREPLRPAGCHRGAVAHRGSGARPRVDPHPYEPGSWGPPAADALLASIEESWCKPLASPGATAPDARRNS